MVKPYHFVFLYPFHSFSFFFLLFPSIFQSLKINLSPCVGVHAYVSSWALVSKSTFAHSLQCTARKVWSSPCVSLFIQWIAPETEIETSANGLSTFSFEYVNSHNVAPGRIHLACGTDYKLPALLLHNIIAAFSHYRVKAFLSVLFAFWVCVST